MKHLLLNRALIVALFFGTLFSGVMAVHAENAEQMNPTPQVKLTTDLGELIIELYPEEAPLTVANFLAYIDQGFYDGTIFHRVIPGFVVQGGGMTFDFATKKTRDPIKNESDNGLTNDYMTLSMARTSAPDSATSQFFINLRPNTSLDARDNRPGYAVFGKVVAGQEVVESIVQQPRGRFQAYPEAPNEAIRILSASRLAQPDPLEQAQ